MKKEKIEIIEDVISELVNRTRGDAGNYTLLIKMTPIKVFYTITTKTGKPIEGSITF